MLGENACLSRGGSTRLWLSGTRACRKLGPLTYKSICQRKMQDRPEERRLELGLVNLWKKRCWSVYTTAASLSADLEPVLTLYVSPHVSSSVKLAWRLLSACLTLVGISMWFWR